jgi:glycosyltransferase involved in cell wall biosynthesis
MNLEVLLITGVYPPQLGGPAVFTPRFKDWLEERNISTKVISYNLGEKSKDKTINFVSIRQNRFKAFIQFIYLVKKYSNKNTLILSNGAFLETYFVCLFSKRKYVIKIPGDQVWEFSVNRGWTSSSIEKFQDEKLRFVQRIFRILLNLAYKNSKSVIVPSKQLANFAEKWGVTKQKINLIYNCVDPNNFNKLKIDKKVYDIITVCRLVSWKGLEELVYCAIELNLSLAIVGDGPLLNELETIAQKFQANVKFLGKMNNNEIENVLNKSRIFVLNSTYEATSYSLIEAKMCGLPVIARKTDGSMTVIQDSIDGFIVEPNTAQNLKYCINKLIIDKEILDNFGFEGRQDALNRFNQDINFPEILRVIRKSS